MGLAERVRELSGSDSPIKLVPYDEAYESGFEDMPRRVPDLTRIEGLIGYKATLQLDEILTQVIDYFRKKVAWAYTGNLHHEDQQSIGVVAWLFAVTTASADVQLTIQNGRVSLVAKDATVRQILTEWARVGDTKIVNIGARAGRAGDARADQRARGAGARTCCSAR